MNKRFPPRYSPENHPLEGLDPPWIPGWTQPVEDYDGGIPARLAEGGLLCVVDPWTQMKEGDTFKFYWNDTTTPVWSTEIDLDQKNQRLVFRIDESHIVRGDTFPVFYSVLRVGGTTPEESDPQWKLLVKLDPPGGFDEEQGTPGHSGLRYSIPQDIIDNGVGSDNTDGVPITIKPYRFMRRNDKINVAWGSENVNHTVAEGEVDQEITITVSREVIERAGDSGGVAVAYQVIDECGNYPGGYWRWSATTPILVDLNNDRLDPPLVLVNGFPTEEIDLEELAAEPVTVRVTANRYEHAVGDILRLTWRGISADGFPVTVGPLEKTVETIPYFYDFTIPYDDVAAIARGRASVAYVRIRSGEADRPSKSTAVTVVGDNRRYGPPGIVEAVGNTLDPDLDFYTLSVPYYSGRVPGDQILIVCEGLTSADHPTYHDVSVIVAGEAVGAPVLGNLPRAQVQRLDGGSLKVYYSVNGQPASDVLALTVGVAAPSLPIPTVTEAPDDVLDPDDVNPNIGANVIVTYTATIPDDVVVLRWRGSSSNAPDDPRTLTGITAGRPVPFTVPFTYVSGNLNGTVDVSYSVTRGTTLLGNSVVRHLTIGAALNLLAPSVKEANGATLNPIDAKDTLTIEVPANTGLLPGDKLRVTWTGASGTPDEGSYTSGESLVSAGLEIEIPNSVVAYNLGKSVTVSYEVIRGNEDPIPSPELTLTVQPLAQDDLLVSKPKILQAANNGEGSELDVSTLTGEATVRIDSWPLIAHGQRIWLRLEGTKTDGSLYEKLWSGTNSWVSMEWYQQGYGERFVPLSELQTLRDGSTLKVEFKASFNQSTDENQAVTFPLRTYTVKALPAELHPPTIKQANGTTLNPVNAKDLLTVVVPANTAFDPNDVLKVTWTGASGTPAGGSYTSVGSLVSSGLEIEIPNSVVAFNLGKAVRVTYTLTHNGVESLPSPPLTLNVQAMPEGSLAMPLIPEAAQGGIGSELDLASFFGDPRITAAPWPLIAADQRVWLRCEGTASGGSDHRIVLYTGSAVIGSEVDAGLSKAIPRAELEKLRDGSELKVILQVTFDRTSSQANTVDFPLRTYTMAAKPFIYDLTTFENGNWNNWRKGPAGADFQHRNGVKGWEIFTLTPSNNNQGVALMKTYNNLQPGVSYEFIVRARRVMLGGSISRLSLSTSAGDVSRVFDIAPDTWLGMNLFFVATSTQMELRVNSHVQTGDGNDYALNNIQLRLV